jgi:hypothetical protein
MINPFIPQFFVNIYSFIVAVTAALAIAPSLMGTVFAKQIQVCPGDQSPCNGSSGDNNPNAFCTTNGANRPTCGNG